MMCNDSTSPTNEAASRSEAGLWQEASGPPAVPVARSVAAFEVQPLAWARPAAFPRLIGPWLAFFELIFLFFSAIAVIIGGDYLTGSLRLDDPRWREVLVTGFVAVFLVSLCLMMVRLGDEPLSVIGWRWDRWPVDIALGVGATILTYLLLFCGSLVLVILKPEVLEGPTPAQRAIESSVPRVSAGWLVLMMAFVAVWEEIVFRGFLLTRLHAIVRRWWAAIPVGAVLFASMHAYEGPLAMVVVGALGVILGILFVWRRSLVPAIVFHLLFNTVGLLVLHYSSMTWE